MAQIITANCYCQSKNFTAKVGKIMPKICQTAKANFSLPNAFENARFELFGILKCQLVTLAWSLWVWGCAIYSCLQFAINSTVLGQVLDCYSSTRLIFYFRFQMQPFIENKKAVLSQRWPRDARYISRSWAVAEIMAIRNYPRWWRWMCSNLK